MNLRATGLLLFLSACGPVDADRENLVEFCQEGASPFQLGYGLTQVNSPVSTQELWFEPGIQGGFHIWAGVTIGAFDPQSTFTEFSLYTDEELVGGRGVPSTYACAETGYQLVGVPVELFFHRPPQLFNEKRMTLKAKLIEQDGTTYEDEFEFTARCCRGTQ